jgi:hypothetical protein
MSDVTRLLSSLDRHDSKSPEELLPLAKSWQKMADAIVCLTIGTHHRASLGRSLLLANFRLLGQYGFCASS